MKTKKVVVVSLFDGLSGGRIALSRIPEIEVLRYYSSEVDKYAIKVADRNYPEDTPFRLGDITQIDGEALRAEIDQDFPDATVLMIGGSPCQGFSLAGKLKGSSTKSGIDVVSLDQYLDLKSKDFEFDGQSYLFWEFVRLGYELRPDHYLLENVKVTKKWLPMFNETLKTEPVFINSSLVSAQNRQRYYWTDLPDVGQPEDRGILLKDILEPVEVHYESEPAIVSEATKKGYIEVEPGECFDYSQPNSKTRRGRAMKEKSNCLLTSHEFMQYVGRPCELRDFKESSTCHHAADATDIKGNDSIKRVYADSGKSPAVTTCQGGHREPKVLCCASRGRYLVDGVRQDAKQLTAGLTEQMLEVRSDEKTNCLTTVQKDNYVVEGLEPGDRVPIKEVSETLVDRDKSYCIDANYHKGGNPKQYFEKCRRQLVFPNNGATYRKLTPLECERLQTLPDGYTEGVSNSQRYKMIGNGWTIEVIVHLLKGLLL